MNIFANLTGRISNFQRERQAISELNGLSDRELNDMGLRRGMIPFAVRNGLSNR